MEELREFIWNHEQNFQLLIAHLFENDPYFYVADLWTGAANRQYSYFAAIGSGADLAAYLIKEYCAPDMPLQSSYAAVIYIIEEVKKHDTYCSGETRARFLLDETGSFFIPQSTVQDFSKMVAKFNPEARKQRIEIVNKFLKDIGESIKI